MILAAPAVPQNCSCSKKTYSIADMKIQQLEIRDEQKNDGQVRGKYTLEFKL